MATVITAAGEELITAKMGQAEILVLDRIILANIPGQDSAAPIDRSEGMPASENIVYQYVIPEDFKGYVTPNQVVHSMLLGSDVGNFTFNWIGLYSSPDDTVMSVTHVPSMDKYKTDLAASVVGNNLTRNIILEFTGAQGLTAITVEAKTWQVDFTVRLQSMDRREREANRDFYGRSCFFDRAFGCTNQDGELILDSGTAYVEGVRIVLPDNFVLPPIAENSRVWLDVALTPSGSDVVGRASFVVAHAGENHSDYTDSAGIDHYLVELAAVDPDGSVTDKRRMEGIDDSVLAYLLHTDQDLKQTAERKLRNDRMKIYFIGGM